jgi:raffinose/stachyose/melibiose transport system permease protein
LVKRYWLDAVSLVVVGVVFVVPFLFIVLTAVKDRADASALDFSWPESWRVIDNVVDVVTARDHMLVRATWNSLVLTVTSVTMLVLLGAMVGFVLARRNDRTARVVNALLLFGLVIPPAVVPTIYVLQEINLFKTLWGLILVEVAFQLPFTVLLFRAFVSTIPREVDEAAMIDGCTSLQLFSRIVLPLLRPVIITVIVTTSVFIYNDFANPLYFTPGSDNATVQLTLYNFQSQFNTEWNLLFMDVLLITIPPLIMFLFFNRKIVAGMTAGSIKG